MKAPILFTTAMAIIVDPAFGQIYLIQGSATPKHPVAYATSLLAVDEDGALRTVSEILPSEGLEWLDVSYDRKKAVLRAKYPSRRIVVLDLEKASAVKSCEDPPAPTGMGTMPSTTWFAESLLPGTGLLYVERFGTKDMDKQMRGELTFDDQALRAMLVDPAVPCERSFVAVDTDEVRQFVSHGQTGVAGLGAFNLMDVASEKDGSLDLRWYGGGRTYLDFKLPADVASNLDHTIIRIVAANDTVVTVSILDADGNRSWRLLAYRRADKTWHQLSEPGASSSWVRAFGAWVATAELRAKGETLTESAGRTEWRRKDQGSGPDLESRFREVRGVIPGILHLFDVAGGRDYTIATKQADSEILVVDDKTVYYRVSDRLYASAIGDKALGPARLVATSELIRDVHWAFVKH